MQLISDHQNFLLYCCWGVEPVRPAGECLSGRFCPGLRVELQAVCCLLRPNTCLSSPYPQPRRPHLCQSQTIECVEQPYCFVFLLCWGRNQVPRKSLGQPGLLCLPQVEHSVLQWGRAWVSWLLMTASWRAGCGQLRRRLLPLPTVKKHFKRIVWDLVGESNLSFISRQDGFASATVFNTCYVTGCGPSTGRCRTHVTRTTSALRIQEVTWILRTVPDKQACGSETTKADLKHLLWYKSMKIT